MLQVAADPLSDAVIQEGLTLLQGELSTKGEYVELTTSSRHSREYTTLIVHLKSIRDLEALMNAPRLVRMASWELPTPFTVFDVNLDDSSPWQTVFTFHAQVSQDMSELIIPYADISYHLILPGTVTQHNALSQEGETLTWRLEAGKTLTMDAQSKVLNGAVPLSIGLGGILFIGSVVGVGIYLFARRRSHRDRYRPAPSLDADYDFDEYEDSEFDYGDNYSDNDYDY